MNRNSSIRIMVRALAHLDVLPNSCAKIDPTERRLQAGWLSNCHTGITYSELSNFGRSMASVARARVRLG